MGIDSVSSDEELPRRPGDEVRYKTHRKHFLSVEVSDWVHTLDAIAIQQGYSTPYTRIPSGEVTVGRRIVRCLPWNCYDAVWYIRLSKVEREIVAAVPQACYLDTVLM